MRLLAALFLSCLVPTIGLSQTKQEQLDFFEQRIRPVLVEHCYECHNSAETSEAGLALDWQGAIKAGSDSGSILDGGNDSLLIRVMRHDIDGLEMPEGGPKLDNRIINDFEKWVGWGAPDPRDEPPSESELAESTSWEAIREKRKQWWSFQPIVSHSPPTIDLPQTYAKWADNPIDKFVFAKQAEIGVQPNDRASRLKIVQRLYVALTGLPPTPVQVRDFLRDPSEEAVGQLVDRLLDSPHFGERWARHWMDWVRYAESHGSEGDPKIEGAEYYRDYLIRALNNDVGYDQLLKEHVAGDLLTEPRINDDLGINESIIGTAHWRMVFHGFAPTDALDERVRFTDDAINSFSKAFLGLTVSCARCHDHKFDAISQADYYAIYGILASTRPGRKSITVDADFESRSATMKAIKQKIRDALSKEWLEIAKAQLPDASEFLAQDLESDSVESHWDKLENDYAEYQAAVSGSLAKAASASWDLTARNEAEEWFEYGPGLGSGPSKAGEFIVEPDGDRLIQGILPSGIYSHLVSNKLGARLTSPDFKLDQNYKLFLEICGGGSAMSRYVVQDYPRNGTVFPVTDLRSKLPDWRWQSYDLKYWQGDDVHIELTTANDAPLLFKNSPRSWFGVRRTLLLPEGAPAPPGKRLDYLQPLIALASEHSPRTAEQLASVLQQAVVAAVEGFSAGELTDQQAEFLDRCLRQGVLPSTKVGLPNTAELVNAYRQVESQIPVAKRIPTLAEWKGADRPLFERGNHKQPSEIVPRRFLEAIDDTRYDSPISGRMQLSKDMLRKDNPFTARVIVNRVWTHLFGRGLVETPDNFGRLGAEPSHPELLDYLASSFKKQDKWSLKSLIRRIVLSETWLQDSIVSREKRELDPSNRYYARYPVRRLDAETIRDKLLAVSGVLNKAPVESPVNGSSDRRSVYVRVKRNALDPFLTTFDAPVPFSTTGLRPTTNVPAQSLLMLNSPFVEKLAQSWGDSLAKRQHLNSEQVIRQAWSRAFGREPERNELAAAVEYLEASRIQYESDRTLRKKIDAEIRKCQEKIDALLEPARTKLLAESASSNADASSDAVATWDFDNASEEELTLKGSSRLEDGQLVLDGKGWAETKLDFDLTEKSLEVVVQLDELSQRGGGIMSVQTNDGVIFDAMVIGEQQPKTWLAGSNNFKRTKPFAKAMQESAVSEPIHLVFSYQADGKVTCYRNGAQYGKPYKTTVQPFKKSNSLISFGIRHGRGLAEGRMFRGKLARARLYDRALTAEEALAASRGQQLVTRQQILAALGRSQQNEVKELEAELEELRQALKTRQHVPANQHFYDLTHAIFNMKEFIYVQ